MSWKDQAEGEVGFRVERQIGGKGDWLPIAYRPPQIQGDPNNPPVWIDFLAPAGEPVTYRVVALTSADAGPASEPTAPLTLE